MDFSAPYKVITPTLEGPILSALANVEVALTRAQITSLLGDASEAGVRKALVRLVEQGIVIEHRFGKRYAYEANREHLLWPSIEGIVSARRGLRERVEALISDWEYAPASVELFGSMVSGASDASSDIDLLIVRPDLDAPAVEIWDQQVGDLHDHIVRWTGNACDIVVLSPGELEEAHSKDEPILRPPTQNVMGASLADLLDQPGGKVAHAAADMAERTSMQWQLEALSRHASAMVGSQEQLRKSFAALTEHLTDVQVPAIDAQMQAIRPLLESNKAAVRAASRILGTYQGEVTSGSAV